MRVLHIITSLADGGAEATLQRLIANDPHDEQFVVSLTGMGKYGPLLREHGFEVRALAMPRGRLTLSGVRGLWRAVRQARPDLIQTWMYHGDFLGGIVGRLADVPVVWGLHNTTLAPGRSAPGTILVARLCGLLSRWVPRRIIACAQAAVSVHAALGYDRARMVVIPNGYDLTQFRRDEEARDRLRSEWGVPFDVPLIGMVARYDPQKDHPNLISALQLLRKRGHAFRAVLVGTGVDSRNAEMLQAIRQAGLEMDVRLMGARADIPFVMNALDVHVLSSISEAFPNVLAEAMACGTPCVTTDVGDAAQIVGETGWVAPPRDPLSLAAALKQALQAWQVPEAWRWRQLACRQRIEERFSIAKMVERYREVWKEVIRCAA